VAHAHLRHQDAVARAPEAVGTPDHIEHHFDLSPGHRRRPAAELDVGGLVGKQQPVRTAGDIFEANRHSLRQEVDRLQGIIKDLAKWLRESGHNLKAALVVKELGGTDEYG
jgi:hypothetical protein